MTNTSSTRSNHTTNGGNLRGFQARKQAGGEKRRQQRREQLNMHQIPALVPRFIQQRAISINTRDSAHGKALMRRVKLLESLVRKLNKENETLKYVSKRDSKMSVSEPHERATCKSRNNLRGGDQDAPNSPESIPTSMSQPRVPPGSRRLVAVDAPGVDGRSRAKHLFALLDTGTRFNMIFQSQLDIISGGQDIVNYYQRPEAVLTISGVGMSIGAAQLQFAFPDDHNERDYIYPFEVLQDHAEHEGPNWNLVLGYDFLNSHSLVRFCESMGRAYYMQMNERHGPIYYGNGPNCLAMDRTDMELKLPFKSSALLSGSGLRTKDLGDV